MIKNEREYRITSAQAERFAKTLAEVDTRTPATSASERILQDAERRGVEEQLADLRDQLAQYEALRDGRRPVDKLRSVEDLPRVLIQTRIARGWGHADLAARLGLKEQQVQRYEATDYASASLARILEVSKALDVSVGRTVDDRVPSLPRLTKRLREAGFSKDFVNRRLLPTTSSQRGRASPSRKIALRAAQRLHDVFGWSVSMLSSELPLRPSQAALARFKAPRSRSEESLQAYASYANQVAKLVLRATEDLVSKPIPRDPYDLHRQLMTKEPEVGLEGLLELVWDLGVPVVPLDDPGSFHGACFRKDGRNAIVVKQRLRSESRWIFDILHELWHAGEHGEAEDWSVIDTEEGSNPPDDEVASQFAGAALLGTNPQEIAEECLAVASRDLRRLKSAVLRVSKDRALPADAVANYLAFRLSQEGINWWGTAAALQSSDRDVWAITRDHLFERADFSRLSESEREFIAQALSPWEVPTHG